MAEAIRDLLIRYDEVGRDIGMVYGYHNTSEPFFMAQWVGGEWVITVNSGNFDSPNYIRALEFTGKDLEELLLENLEIYRWCGEVAREINGYQEKLNGMGMVLYFYSEMFVFVAKTGEYGIFKPQNAIKKIDYEYEDNRGVEQYKSFLIALRNLLEEVCQNP